MSASPSSDKLELFRVASRFAWPAAFVAAVAIVTGAVRDRATPATSEVAVHPSATVVKGLRDLARLETTSLHVEKVVDLEDRQKRLFGLLESEDALLYVAAGEVVVGVDLGRLRDDDARFDEATRTVHLTLPEPEVLSTRFDEVRSHVHARHTDVLAKRNEQLEALARQEASAAFASAGRDATTVARAKEQAEKEIRALATSWGARDVVIAWRPIVGSEVAATKP